MPSSRLLLACCALAAAVTGALALTQPNCTRGVAPFCGDRVPYAVDVGKLAGGVGELDALARQHYDQMASRLAQYKCSDAGSAYFYSPLLTCDDCLAAYRDWICGVIMTRCAEDGLTTVKPCLSLCRAVVVNCPQFLEFRCPVGDDLAATTYGGVVEGAVDACNAGK